MHFIFEQAVSLEGKDYTRGAHQLPEPLFRQLSKNETFLKYCELGLIKMKAPNGVISSDSLLERNQKLAEKFSAPKVEAIKPDAETVGETSDSLAEQSEPKEMDTSVKSKKRK